MIPMFMHQIKTPRKSHYPTNITGILSSLFFFFFFSSFSSLSQ